jgi:hypothetical protein
MRLMLFGVGWFLGFVVLRLDGVCFMCPFVVFGEKGRWYLMAVSDKPGRVARKPF